MKKYFILAAMLLWGAAAMAASPHFAAALSYDGQTYVYTDFGKAFQVEGKILSVFFDGATIWTLTTPDINYLCGNLICHEYRVYKNTELMKTYKGNSNERYFSVAMRVKDGHVVVAGSKVRGFNKKGVEACLFGEVDFKKSYQTDYVRKSLKRENFRGFSVIDSGQPLVPAYDADGTYNLSVYYGVKDVDYYKGNIYASGWGEREYTNTYRAVKYYLVRRCPRVWKNGKEYLQQFENQTGAAYFINVVNAGGKKHVLTSGHHRGTGCGWDGEKIMYTYPKGEFAVESEAVITKGSKIYRCSVVNRDHLCFTYQSDSSGGEPDQIFDSTDYDSIFYDVVADPANMDFYVLTSPFKDSKVEIWRFHCSGSTLKAPKKVLTLSVNKFEDRPKLAIISE